MVAKAFARSASPTRTASAEDTTTAAREATDGMAKAWEAAEMWRAETRER